MLIRCFALRLLLGVLALLCWALWGALLLGTLLPAVRESQ
jgi:hypothetical protein